MASSDTLSREGTGFSFDNVHRNALLTRRGVKEPTQRSTGTTLAGLIFKAPICLPIATLLNEGSVQDGVILGADTRATAGTTVADKNTKKLSYLTSNIYCAGAGTAADCEHVTGMVSSALTLHALDTGRQIRVITAETIIKNHLRRYGGHVSAALILGGVDLNGPHLASIFPHGSTDSVPYATMGSGSLNAMSVLESGYVENMDKAAAMELLTNAVRAGIYNDLGSGSNVDLVIITKEGTEMIRGHQYLMEKTYARAKPPRYPPGTAKVIKEQTVFLKDLVIDDADAMDTS